MSKTILYLLRARHTPKLFDYITVEKEPRLRELVLQGWKMSPNNILYTYCRKINNAVLFVTRGDKSRGTDGINKGMYIVQ